MNDPLLAGRRCGDLGWGAGCVYEDCSFFAGGECVGRSVTTVGSDGVFPRPTHGTFRNWLYRRSLYPRLGYCLRCGESNQKSLHHTTYFDDVHGMFPLCESCWSRLTTFERMSYYDTLVNVWIGQCPEKEDEYESDRERIFDAVMAGG